MGWWGWVEAHGPSISISFAEYLHTVACSRAHPAGVHPCVLGPYTPTHAPLPQPPHNHTFTFQSLTHQSHAHTHISHTPAHVQLVLLGSGRDDLEGALRDMEARNKAQCRAWVGFSVSMAHRITAGCDILLMPSRFEP